MPTTDSRPVTLSVDNGPDPKTTPVVLVVLERRGVKATFFVVGKNLAAHRAPAERAVAEGHWIGNHTWSHSRPFRDNGAADFVRAEIERTQQAIGDLVHPERLFRPYGGDGRLDGALNHVAADHLAAGGFTCVLWNAVPGDWKNPDGWPDVALRQVAQSDWPLVVLHDVYPLAMRHLDDFIGALQDRGCDFRQDFPPDCVAMRCGVNTHVMDRGVVAD
jgi:peptidoglycan/xylan/chitin deacetylase (PgdA/CDA1 family)